MESTNTSEPIKGYKVTNPDGTCRGFQFEVGKEYKIKGRLEMCGNGFHFCKLPNDCFNYYGFDADNRVFEVEALGDVVEGSDKCVTSKIKFLRELTWIEVLTIINTGKNNTGRSNSGNWNSGDSNSGYRNSGYSNSGNWNSGYRNSGDSNSGYRNSGDSNSGYRNSGNWNSGNWNSGYRNSGDSNSGYRNSGDSNSGNWNSGYRNSGDSNSGYRNSGAFCTEKNPALMLFDKPASISVLEWERSEACQVMNRLLDNGNWIYSHNMTDEEKKKCPSHETTGGYLKMKTTHEMWADAWHNMDSKTRKLFTNLENFDPAKFKEITGIDVNDPKQSIS